MGWKTMLVLIFSLLVINAGKCDLMKRSEYNKMPKMFEFENYDDCLYSDPEVKATYCVVKAVIKPNASSELWKTIENFSSNKKLHLNHAVLDRGLCIYNVEEELAKFKDVNTSGLVVSKFDIDFPYNMRHDPFRNKLEYVKNYSEIVSIKINKDLDEKHGLKAYTEIEYCDRAEMNEYPIDYLDVFFLIVVATLITLTASSTWYDYKCKVGFGLDHYREDMPNRKSMYLASFSVIRNWYRLTAHSRTPLNRDLRMIQSVRYHTFIITLIGHASILVQPRSGWILEQKYRELATMIIVNGFQIVTTFFAISALVFTISFVEKLRESGRKPSIMTIVLVTVNRYIRLTPVYAVVLLFEATWFIRLLDGPMWRTGVEPHLTFCRRNWWINLLYLNNYMKLEEPCMQHSWYLACDFQLSFIGLILVTLILRMPRIKIPLLATMTAVSLIIPALVVYQNAFEGVLIFSPEAKRFVFLYEKAYQLAYLPAHMNFNMYIWGVMVGLLYYKLKSLSYNLGSKMFFRVIWYLCFIISPAMFLLGKLFYVNDFPTPSIWMSIYFAATRGCWALILSIGFIGFLYRVNKPVARFMNIRIFEILGRLTYGAYIGHFAIMKMMFYSERELSNLDTFAIAVKIHATVLLSYMLSVVLTLGIELPTSAIQKQLFKQYLKRSAEEENLGSPKANGLKGHTNVFFKDSFNGKIDINQ
ncbi:nose resistant to fluoxetine protein 6-like [Toxorhynchites rutilus septentrionalis]|uniref:nose resistant to fluoxetine protein 6-like n=1 Tax=Toxorhynchites rutilus septentrionalis TaxID=329112 RepID=UPI002478DB24|nr:nose resistant to fluoxetine protein 6-like [Toxorhynchites rutilus septentrionalis]